MAMPDCIVWTSDQRGLKTSGPSHAAIWVCGSPKNYGTVPQPSWSCVWCSLYASPLGALCLANSSVGCQLCRCLFHSPFVSNAWTLKTGSGTCRIITSLSYISNSVVYMVVWSFKYSFFPAICQLVLFYLINIHIV